MPEIATWSDPDFPYPIEYAPAALEKLRAAAMEGLMALPKVGMGSGGVLLGESTGNRITILDSFVIPCSHAFGPSFSLTPEELDHARELVAQSDTSKIVGWYCSKGLRPLEVSDNDRVLFGSLFTKPWRVGLLLRPNMVRPTTIAFFWRGAQGEAVKGVEGELSAWAAPVPLVVAADVPTQKAAPAEAVVPTQRAAAPAADEVPVAQKAPGPAPDEQDIDIRKQIFTIDPELWPSLRETKLKRERENIPSNSERPVIRPLPTVSFEAYRATVVKESPPKKGPVVALAAAAAILISIAGVVLVVMPGPHQAAPRPPLVLHSTDAHGALTIQWNPDGVEGIDHASLFIDDGGRLHTIPLDRSQLTSGEFVYARKSSHVTATVTADGTEATTEFTASSGKPSPTESRP
jgi:hypothetical protein